MYFCKIDPGLHVNRRNTILTMTFGDNAEKHRLDRTPEPNEDKKYISTALVKGRSEREGRAGRAQGCPPPLQPPSPCRSSCAGLPRSTGNCGGDIEELRDVQ
ncbi:unnamed protein product [Rangifer tarandus platyrhynchus]|uniref:Uncharacterized protein n=2 Tax=Rangifer tarandus platyrhynchus TaxID=3082113 RepID=A0ABN9A0I5_RANTA|nr:unnamed protein product [Rangifer tarandus platyrhynchus]